MLKITLNIGGEVKEFTQEKITFGAMRRLAEMDKNMKDIQKNGSEEEQGVETMDELAMTIVTLFRNQFTFNELLDGLEFDSMDEFNEIVEDIFKQVGDSTGGKPKTATKRTTKRQSK